ncbi:type Z 30S ribosomal protein S14 [Candidatus Peregrinibacteria bacterium CG22_combo_CG10-13_8_21_14_all_44_10]|nr:MAG: type Z 30S ribosomal protein S14 [Candidatus Peregrinibacteria bacterium CG22_combo_CG10-13_8_21_14_all_44_10]PIS03621.1 MAG: type Z 30S ribosomal protein S14 [Candidatus Peregrinibacteria bacterium CG10_big_fil_rev_8_21_14_0_10_44_7]PIX78883.1 MAG: type Z 30S ribosomal protein S14 [Candidatus Peregrinibacteria bacterium CG_4_10_14_3_um_filter_44_21]PJB88866.1 MAG: type Z 30S ribosomal protein S14 [Candidatus Peregrinibacteria bacterium CG_4_9_14_0_8_um_filter_44_15]
MAKTSLIVKCENRQKAHTRAVNQGKKPKMPTRTYNRCKNCGRPKAYMRRFGVCRICFRELVQQGAIMGVKKSSW